MRYQRSPCSRPASGPVTATPHGLQESRCLTPRISSTCHCTRADLLGDDDRPPKRSDTSSSVVCRRISFNPLSSPSRLSCFSFVFPSSSTASPARPPPSPIALRRQGPAGPGARSPVPHRDSRRPESSSRQWTLSTTVHISHTIRVFDQNVAQRHHGSRFVGRPQPRGVTAPAPKPPTTPRRPPPAVAPAAPATAVAGPIVGGAIRVA